MKHLLSAFMSLLIGTFSFSQSTKIKPNKYPSLLWEIKGKGIKTSYLFGTMHVSSKMAFNLSDSFYLGIKNAQVVALETNPGTWQEDFSRYDMGADMLRRFSGYGGYNNGYGTPSDYLTINSLKLNSYEKMMEAAMYSSPSVINNFLYRNNGGRSSDFEEDTYLDLHIFQAGKKLGKKVNGVEDFDGSMKLVKEAYADAAREKNKKERSYDIDEAFSYRKLEEAYRTGNLDLLDTINKVNSQSEAFDEKFLYKRNEIQAESIDSILKTGQSLFVGVGAAHLPGERGVIEMLRRAGYSLRPIKMSVRDSQHKDAIEKMRVPVTFAKQEFEDGFISVSVPGKLYDAGMSYGGADMRHYADMTNGSYYMVTRILTNAAILGHSQTTVERKIDSVLYENIPGKLLSKKAIVKNGYRGFEVTNRTRRGDYQRYNIFATPFEIILFKMSGNGDYVKLGTEADQFFNSIQLKAFGAGVPSTNWKLYKPAWGGFEADLPHEPLVFKKDGEGWQYAAYDNSSSTGFNIMRTDIHNYGFVEEDTFDLSLMEESFRSSEFVERETSRAFTTVGGYPALNVGYKFKDSSVAQVRFLIDGPRYYTLIAKAETENKTIPRFINSFRIKPFVYAAPKKETDTALHFTVSTPVPLEKKKKLEMFESSMFNNYGRNNDNDDDSLIDDGKYESKIYSNDTTGEKIYVSFYKPSRYDYFDPADAKPETDTAEWSKEWVRRYRRLDTLADKTRIWEYEWGGKNSSRVLKSKGIEKGGMSYRMETEMDTLSGASPFIKSFFESFALADTINAIDEAKKKTGLWFTQFFSSDTLEHKKAVKNIHNVYMDSSDFPQIKRAIASLNWKEKKYLEVKKDLVSKLRRMDEPEITDFLRDMYFAAGDTVELQHLALQNMLNQQTAYAYKTFAGIMEADPPVLNVSTGNSDYSSIRLRNRSGFASEYNRYNDDYDNDRDYSDGEFMNNLTDTLKLTAGIYKKILPLINLDDYEEPIMDVTATLVDSSAINPKEYEAYVPKFLIEARQALKKQVIQEKAAAIQKAQKDDEEKDDYSYRSSGESDYGNNKLSLYNTLLMPYWDKNEGVPKLVNSLLSSNSKRLKYNTLMQLLEKGRAVPDTMFSYFAGLDEYRYELYTDLKRMKKLDKFPKAQKTQLALAKSELMDRQSYDKPDTIAFMQKMPLTYKGLDGWIYVFKYKEKKADNNWKLATVGLVPKDSTLYEFDERMSEKEAIKFWEDNNAYRISFTDYGDTKLTTETPESEQLQKMLKRMVYSKRQSASRFYTENWSGSDYDMSNVNFGD